MFRCQGYLSHKTSGIDKSIEMLVMTRSGEEIVCGGQLQALEDSAVEGIPLGRVNLYIE